MKTGRNDPCPCGSGKKYKHCCLANDNIIPFPTHEQPSGSPLQNEQMMELLLQSTGFSTQEELDSAMERYKEFCESRNESDGPCPSFMEFMGQGNMASQQMHQMEKDLSGMDFETLEEADEYLKGYNELQNNKPLDDFLGLNPQQMQRILSYEIRENEVLVQINRAVSHEDVKDTRIVSLSLFLFQMIRDAGGALPLTATGNMKRVHCTAFWEFLFDREPMEGFEISSEDHVPELSRLRYLLEETGYIDRMKTKIRLSEKGTEVLEREEGTAELYLNLLDFYSDFFDWLGDYFFNDSCSIVQDSALFSLYMLHKKAGRFIHQDKLYELFHTAFPMIDEIPVLPSGINIMPRVYEIMFLDNFCLFFGLVEKTPVEGVREKWLYKTTDLFTKLFQWLV